MKDRARMLQAPITRRRKLCLCTAIGTGVLFGSRRTAATHVRHIYDKLALSSRAEAAAWAVRIGAA